MFYVLRKHRRLVSAAVLVALGVWLSAVLGNCLLAPAPPVLEAMAAAASGTASDSLSNMGPCPGGLCATMQSDREIVADQEIVPTAPKLLLVALLLVATLFAPVTARQGAPRPPGPPHPGRSPFLRFHALRI